MTAAGAAAGRWAWAEIDADAIRANVATIAATVAPAAVWAGVKADGYGHGAVTAARAAIAGGATGLGVALVQEGIELRAAGLTAPVLVLSPQPFEQFGDMVRHELTPTLASLGAIEAWRAAVRSAGRTAVPVHLKFDTGMRRVGAPPEEAVELASAVIAAPELRLGGVFTHLAVADEPTDFFTGVQLGRFDALLDDLAAAGIEPELVHAANSAAALVHVPARRSMVRVGIAAYGIEPGPGVRDWCRDLRPALRLVARVSHVKHVAAGEGISYGLRHRFERGATVATLPIGYADGVPRRLSANGGEVLLGGRRCPIVGVVTMDQLMVDCGDLPVAVGDLAVLLGAQGDDRIGPEEWAERLGTIPYEIVCGISGRIRRVAPRR